jgi:hypothetical protein
MTPEDTEDAFAFTTFTPAATGTVERSGRWVTNDDGNRLWIDDDGSLKNEPERTITATVESECKKQERRRERKN